MMRPLHYALIGVAVLLLGTSGWKHRNDTWVQDLLRPSGAVQTTIRFDNGSVRDKLSAATHAPNDASALNVPGKLKKCAGPQGVIYTDQICPPGSKAAPVNGGNVTVIDGTASKSEVAKPPGDAPKALRDALDLSGNNQLREKMVERAMGQ